MGRKQNYPIALSEMERAELESIVKGGKNRVRVVRRAQMLLWSAAGKSDLEIADLVSVNPLTVAQTRQRWVEEHYFIGQSPAGASPPARWETRSIPGCFDVQCQP